MMIQRPTLVAICLALVGLSALFFSQSCLAYSKAKIKNNTDYTVKGTVKYASAFCSNDKYTVGPRGSWTAKSRGACLITAITGKLSGSVPSYGQVKSVSSYSSTGTSYSKFEVNAFGDRFRIFSEQEFAKVSRTQQGKSPGFRLLNKTDWPLVFSLDQAGCLYHGIVPKTFNGVEGVARRDTGAVWFTLTVRIKADGVKPISDWDCVEPVAEIVGDVALGVLTGGTAGAAMAGAKIITKQVAKTVVKSVVKTSIKEVGKAAAAKIGAYLLDAGSVTMGGQYAGYPWPARCANMPEYHVTGGPQLKQDEFGDVYMMPGEVFKVTKVNSCGNAMMKLSPLSATATTKLPFPSDEFLRDLIPDPSDVLQGDSAKPGSLGAAWEQKPGKAIDIGVSGNSVWSISNTPTGGGNTVRAWSGKSWLTNVGGAKRIDVDGLGNPWVVNDSGSIFEYDNRINRWAQRIGKARDIGVGADGTVWVIGTTAIAGGYTIYKYVGAGFVLMPVRGGVRIDVDPKGVPWMVDSAGKVYRYNGFGFAEKGTDAQDIGIGIDGSVWKTGRSGQISRYDGDNWVAIDGAGVDISVDALGLPWVVNSNGDVYQRLFAARTLIETPEEERTIDQQPDTSTDTDTSSSPDGALTDGALTDGAPPSNPDSGSTTGFLFSAPPDTVRIQNRFVLGRYINLENGLTAGGVEGGWWSAQWDFEEVGEFVRIRNRWKPSEYLNIENGRLDAGTIKADWLSAQWLLIAVPGTGFVQIQNRLKPTEYIHAEFGTLESGAIEPGWHSAQWLLAGLGVAVVVGDNVPPSTNSRAIPMDTRATYHLKPLSGDNQCLESNLPSAPVGFGGASYVTDCGNFTGQMFSFIPSAAGTGEYALTSLFAAPEGRCMEGNKPLAGNTLDGAAFMDLCGSFTGQAWKFVRVPLAVTSSAGFYLGTTVFGNSESRCLTAVSKEIATGVAASGAAAMDVCDSASNAQVWELVRTRDGEPAADTDKDGLTDVEEQALGTDFLNPDTDQDGIFDAEDSTQLSDPKADTDGDGISDADDSDDDNDGVDDTDDAFPLDATESEDTDNDGKGNNADDDDDNDGVLDADDSFGLAPANVDTDGDGVIDSKDALPLISLAGLVDTDGDGLPDACDAACVARGLRADTLDSRGPVISLTTPLQIDAIGPLTRLSPTAATATDATDDSVRLVATPRGPYISGRHVITWIASDSDGNVTTREQVLEIKPMVLLQPDQRVAEGAELKVKALLSGPAVNYPVTINYAVSGTADAADVTGLAGSVVIERGIWATISTTVVADNVADPDETIVLTLLASDEVILSQLVTHTATIVEGNIVPTLEFTMSQGDVSRPVVYVDGGIVTVAAQAEDANPGDSLSYDWSRSNRDLGIGQATAATVTFDPSALSPGRYTARLSVTDSQPDAATIRRKLQIIVLPTKVALSSSVDTDGDGQIDSDEGDADSDGDGIEDYRDNNADVSVLPMVEGADDLVVQTDPGLRLKLGAIALLGNKRGVELTDDDLVPLTVQSQVKVETIVDTAFSHAWGLFDFEVDQLPIAGQTVRVVLPLAAPLAANAVYRKYSELGGWTAFIENATDQVTSAPGQLGECPPVGDSAYVAGLVEGSYCVQLSIADGGPNDADGEVNRVVQDPGAVSVPSGIEALLARMSNISTRGSVGSDDAVLIGGVIITGTQPKNVLIRARGPSMTALGVAGVIADPFLQLFSGSTVIDTNDNWASHARVDEIIPGLRPTSANEAAIYTTLDPGAYTAIVRGVNNTTGVGIVEIFEIDEVGNAKLLNIATRGYVGIGDNVLIGGVFISGNTPKTVTFRARGPSMTALGVQGVLADPLMQLFDVNGDLLDTNDNWQDHASASALRADLQPTEASEAVITTTLEPGAYTVVIRGVNETEGVGIVEVFAID